MRTTFLDLETTGLDPVRDEILEIGILDDAGAILLDSLVCPTRRRSWPAAQRIHGIDPAAVSASPTLAALRPRLVEAVAGTRVVIYNASFDTGFLGPDLAGAAEIACAMKTLAATFPDRRWRTLGAAAAYVGFRWPGHAHRAIHDCMATRAVWQWINAHAVPIRTVPAAALVQQLES